MSGNRRNESMNSLPGYSWAAHLLTRGCVCVCVCTCAWLKCVNMHFCMWAFSLCVCACVCTPVSEAPSVLPCAAAFPWSPRPKTQLLPRQPPHTPYLVYTQTHVHTPTAFQNHLKVLHCVLLNEQMDWDGSFLRKCVCACLRGRQKHRVTSRWEVYVSVLDDFLFYSRTCDMCDVRLILVCAKIYIYKTFVSERISSRSSFSVC